MRSQKLKQFLLKLKQNQVVIRTLGFVFLIPLMMLLFNSLTPFFVETVDSTYLENNPDFQADYYVATVSDAEVRESEVAGREIARAVLQSGNLQGEEIDFFIGRGVNGEQSVSKGEQVIIVGSDNPNGYEYSLADSYRLPQVLFAFFIFIALTVSVAGKRGITSIFGLAASIFVISVYILPQIAAGANPFVVSFLGANIIAILSLFLAHGPNKQTLLAVVSTLVTITLATVFAEVFTSMAALTGLGSDEAGFVQYLTTDSIDLRGILLGGMIIGALGVLDDITTAQTAAVREIARANAKLGFTDLLQRSLKIGKEHIASLVNSLALAYVGASLPLFLLISSLNDSQPFWMVLNSEFIMEEVVRTLVGSTALVLAVPISTMIAAYIYGRKIFDAEEGEENHHGHVHHHH